MKLEITMNLKLKKDEQTYATMTTSSPNTEVLWYAALSPAAHADAYKFLSIINISFFLLKK